jgi:hypothetical protein
MNFLKIYFIFILFLKFVELFNHIFENDHWCFSLLVLGIEELFRLFYLLYYILCAHYLTTHAGHMQSIVVVAVGLV